MVTKGEKVSVKAFVVAKGDAVPVAAETTGVVGAGVLPINGEEEEDAEGLGVPVPSFVGDSAGVPEGLIVGVPVGVGVPEVVSVGVPEGLIVGDPDGVMVPVEVLEAVFVVVPVGEGVNEAV